jgi:hypothetical protein
VTTTSKYSIIPIDDIERDVHLISRFGSVGESANINKELDRILEGNRYQMEKEMSSGDILILNKSDLIMNQYKEFWLNSWLDPHMYKNIF